MTFMRETAIKFGSLFDRFRLEVPFIRQIQYSPILAQLIVTRRCNIECGYCNEYDLHSEPVPFEVLVERVEKLRQLGTVSIEFSGGEPLLHPDITDLVKYATDHHFVKRMMITNAYLLTEDTVLKLNDSGLTNMQVSIDGVKSNDVTVKVLEPLRRKLRMLSEKAEFTVTLNSVIGAAPPEEVKEVFDFAEDMGFLPRVLVIHDHEGKSRLGKENIDLYRELRSRISKSKAKKNYTDKLLEGKGAPFKCRAGSRYLYIDEFGFVRYCSQKRDMYKKPLLEMDTAELRKNFYTPHSCSTWCTIGCAPEQLLC